MEEDLSKSPENIQNIVENRLSEHFMGQSKKDRYQALRHDLGPGNLAWAYRAAYDREDYEICATVIEVEENNIETFDVRFSLGFIEANKATVVHFQEDGVDYYHADYQVNGGVEGSLVMLHKNDSGVWFSEWTSANPAMFQPIGAAIDEYNRDRNRTGIH